MMEPGVTVRTVGPRNVSRNVRGNVRPANPPGASEIMKDVPYPSVKRVTAMTRFKTPPSTGP